MNIATPLIPIAAAALDTMVQGVGSVLRNENSFTRLFHTTPQSQAMAKADPPTTVADLAPEQSELAQQVRRDAWRQRFETLRQSVHQRLVQRFAEQGIDLSEPVVLALDASGHLLETSGHWDRGQIEQLLQSDGGLRSEIVELLQQGSALRDSGSAGTKNGIAGTSRLVVSEKEVFFQVV